MEYTKKEDIRLLRLAYRRHESQVTLSDGRTIVRRERGRFHGCAGCVFVLNIGCYCENGEIWVNRDSLSEMKKR